MIRINLLVRKVSKKKAGAIQHLAIGAGAIVLLSAALAWVWFDQAGKLARLKTQIAAQEAEKVRLKNVNEEKARFEKEKAELERKLAIITKLQKERIVPVHLLDELTRVIDVGTPVWVYQLRLHPRRGHHRRLLAQPRGAAAAGRRAREVRVLQGRGAALLRALGAPGPRGLSLQHQVGRRAARVAGGG